jgi:ribosomal protein S18 acetylase RimI-like enzyme
MMTNAQPSFPPEGLQQAIEANSLAFWELFCSRPGMEFHREAGLVWFVSGVASPTLNGVLWADLPAVEIESAIEATLRRFRDRRLPMEWRVGPTSRPKDLGLKLARRGFTLTEDIPALYLELPARLPDSPGPDGFRMERVDDAPRLEAWFEAWGQGFEVPSHFSAAFRQAYRHVGFGEDRPLCNLLGTLHGEPVATATVFMTPGMAGLHSIATVAGRRRQGIGAQMTRAALELAADRRARHAFLYSTPVGESLYRRLGFRPCGRQQIYLAPE